MTRAMVTGGSGFIGRHLVAALLDAGHEVRAALRERSDASVIPADVQIVRGSLRDEAFVAASMRDVDVVYHLAGLTKSLVRQDLWDVNEACSDTIARVAAAQPSPPTILIVSSLAAAGPNPIDPQSGTTRPRRESDPESPVSDYGRSKLAGDNAARAYADRVPMSFVRPPIVLGPGDRDGLELFKPIRQLRVHFVPGWRSDPFSAIHVADLIPSILAVVANGERCVPADDHGRGVYFVGDPQPIDYCQLGRMIGRSVGRDHAWCVRLPRVVVRTVAGFNQTVSRLRGRPHIFGWDKAREALATGWACDVSKLHRDCGFRCSVDLQTRIHETANWYRNAGWL